MPGPNDYLTGLLTKDWLMSQIYPELYQQPPEAYSFSQSPQSAAVQRLVELAAQERQQATEKEATRSQAEAEARAKRQRETNLASLESLTEMPAETLARIRAEAKAKGRAGSLGAAVEPTQADIEATRQPSWTEGVVSQGANTPEYQARIAERDRWLAGQPMREQEFLASAEQARRNPELAAEAAKTLVGMRRQQEEEQQRELQLAFINKLAGAGGTIPPEQAVQLQALGIKVPPQAFGTSRNEAVAFFDSMIEQGGKYLASRGPEMAGLDDNRSKVEKWGMLRAKYYRDLVAADKMNYDDAVYAFQQEMAEVSMAQGLLSNLGFSEAIPAQ